MQKHDVISISLDHAICSTYDEREQDKSQPEDQEVLILRVGLVSGLG